MSSTYCTRSDVEAQFGVKNVERWAKLEDGYTASQITSRINAAIDAVSENIDDMLRAGAFEIPVTDSSGATPASIKEICAVMAGVWLYESRGVDDVDQAGNPRHKLQFLAERAERRLEQITARVRKINTASNTG